MPNEPAGLDEWGQRVGAVALLGSSPEMRRVRHLVQRFARSRLSVLLVGETGTGKELAARMVHDLSGRPGPLVALNCGAMPRDLIEGELFGHRRGSFTSASSDNEGLLKSSDRGSVFLDELTSLPLEGQSKLLRVLETGYVRSLGATRGQTVDLRFISAAQDDLEHRIQRGEWREDLFQRLAGVVIRLPPLRQRMDDVPELTMFFARAMERTIPAHCLDLLLGYSWPGNVRELKSTIERAILLSDDDTITSDAIAEAIDLGRAGCGSPLPAEDPARLKLLQVCQMHRGDAAKVAGTLGVHRATLYRWLNHYGIRLRAFQESGPVARLDATLRDSVRLEA